MKISFLATKGIIRIYACFKRRRQCLDLQRDALIKAGVVPERIYEYLGSGGKMRALALKPV